MPLNKGKHIIAEIEGVRCTVVEANADESRIQFLSDLLKFNKFDVKVQENTKKADTDPVSFLIGVTDMIFNPVIAVYQKKLKKSEGGIVTPAYWNQDQYRNDIPYWTVAIAAKEDYLNR